MNWTSDLLGRLTDAVSTKYDDHFWNCLPAWREYLNESGIEWIPEPNVRSHIRKKGTGETFVWIECPWSVHNSPIGNINGKVSLLIPAKLAEKIVTLGEMPPALTKND